MTVCRSVKLYYKGNKFTLIDKAYQYNKLPIPSDSDNLIQNKPDDNRAYFLKML
ncbi:hypothetical protein SPPR111872_13505 [Sphingobacterium prati]